MCQVRAEIKTYRTLDLQEQNRAALLYVKIIYKYHILLYIVCDHTPPVMCQAASCVPGKVERVQGFELEPLRLDL